MTDILYHCTELSTQYTNMKSKAISPQAGKLLTYFYQRDQPCFTISQALQGYSQHSKNALAKLLSTMTQQGLLMRVQQGLYCIIPYEQDPATFMPNWHRLAPYLVKEQPYYIGYYAALQIHGLITQPALKEQIVVNKQIRPAVVTIKEIPFQFIYHNKNHFFGFERTWINDFNQVYCADLEKIFIDCLFKPAYAGGIVEIAKALLMAKERIDQQKLWMYLERFNCQAVIKRLGFLLELFESKTSLSKKLQKLKTPSFVLLDPEIPLSGKRISRWSIQQNVDTATLRSALLT